MKTTLPLTSIYRAKHLPTRYVGETYESTQLVKSKGDALRTKIFSIPTSGQLLVSGTAGPIVNQLHEMGKKIYGVSYVDHYNDQFGDGNTSLPKKVEVVVLHGIGNEPAKNFEYSARLLISILDFYKARDIMLILETNLTVTDFQTKYGLDISTSISLRLKKEESWL